MHFLPRVCTFKSMQWTLKNARQHSFRKGPGRTLFLTLPFLSFSCSLRSSLFFFHSLFYWLSPLPLSICLFVCLFICFCMPVSLLSLFFLGGYSSFLSSSSPNLYSLVISLPHTHATRTLTKDTDAIRYDAREIGRGRQEGRERGWKVGKEGKREEGREGGKEGRR